MTPKLYIVQLLRKNTKNGLLNVRKIECSGLDLDLCLPDIATGVEKVRDDDVVHRNSTMADAPLYTRA